MKPTLISSKDKLYAVFTIQISESTKPDSREVELKEKKFTKARIIKSTDVI